MKYFIIILKLTACWTGYGEDFSGGLLAGENWRSGHEEPRHLPLLGGHGPGLGGQEQVVLLAFLQVHGVDAGLKIFPWFINGPGPFLGLWLQKQQLNKRSNCLLSILRLSFEYL